MAKTRLYPNQRASGLLKTRGSILYSDESTVGIQIEAGIYTGLYFLLVFNVSETQNYLLTCCDNTLEELLKLLSPL